MNVRQQLYKKYRLEGYTSMAAALKAGYKRNTAIAATRNIDKRINFAVILEAEGLTDSALAKHAVEGLNANKIISANITYGDADEKTNDFIEVPDWQVRHRYFETIVKLLGKMKAETIVNNTQNNFSVTYEWNTQNNQDPVFPATLPVSDPQ